MFLLSSYLGRGIWTTVPHSGRLSCNLLSPHTPTHLDRWEKHPWRSGLAHISHVIAIANITWEYKHHGTFSNMTTTTGEVVVTWKPGANISYKWVSVHTVDMISFMFFSQTACSTLRVLKIIITLIRVWQLRRLLIKTYREQSEYREPLSDTTFLSLDTEAGYLDIPCILGESRDQHYSPV